MVVNFDCLENEFKDRYDFQHCLTKIKESYLTASYIETDDICRFIKKIQKIMYETLDILERENDQIGASIVVDNVFDVILLLHQKIGNKHDILEEFNTINEILNEFDQNVGPKTKLEILQQIKEQCMIYQERSVEELDAARKLRQDQTITRDDYQFLNE